MIASLAVTYGVVLIGCTVAAFLYGIACVQVCRYSLLPSQDSKFLRWAVNTLWMVDTLHVAFTVASVYYFLIIKRADLQLGGSPFWTDGTVLIIANTSDLLVRAIFIYRVCQLTDYNIPLLISLGALAFVAAGFGIACGALFMKIAPANLARTLTWPVYAALALSAAADISISLTMSGLFIRFGQRAESAQPLLQRLAVYTVSAGMLPSILALASLITYILFTETYIAMAIFFVLPQATLNTMLAMLNARKQMRKILPKKSNNLGRVQLFQSDA